jgi:hypothetical protein
MAKGDNQPHERTMNTLILKGSYPQHAWNSQSRQTKSKEVSSVQESLSKMMKEISSSRTRVELRDQKIYERWMRYFEMKNKKLRFEGKC